MLFVYGYTALYAALLILPIPDPLVRIIGIAALAAWYFTHAKTQIKHVDNVIPYEKKSWQLPILSGIAGLVIYTGVAVAIGVLSEPSLEESLEKESVALVTRVLKENTTFNTSCKKVVITKALPKKTFQAVAILENGTTLDIIIKVKGAQFFVEFETSK